MTTQLTGLIGYPTEHSLSPRIHGYWIAQHKLDAEYKLFTTKPARLRQTVLHLRKKPMAGFNITIPHKQAVMEYLDSVDVLATRIGAVNTVIAKNGKLAGTNTDAYGFIASLQQSLGDLSPHLKNVVILGAGGATRAVVVALQDAGAKHITLTNRTDETAQKLAKEFGVETALWSMRQSLLGEATLLVNTTSLGMQGHPPLVLDLLPLSQGAVVDIVYAPLETDLLRNARARGLPAVDGLGMLLYQAQAAFEAWFGMKPEVTQALREHVLAGAA
jgi:shikimate dehydrogenase